MSFHRFSVRRRLVVAGLLSSLFVLTSPSSVALAADGDFDLTFDTDGKVTTAFTLSHDDANDVAVQSDGKIVVVGEIYDASGTNFGLVRYNTNGTLDNTFGTGGLVSTSFGSGSDVATAVALQSDGKIVVVGTAGVSSVPYAAVARYNTNGTLDNTFDSDGKATMTFRGSPIDDRLLDVVIQPDGKIVASGWTYPGMSYPEPGVVRFNSNGTVDFSTAITTGVYSEGSGIALQPDGKIVVAGVMTNSSDDIAVWRVTTAGVLDTSFSGDGLQTAVIPSTSDTASAVGVQPDGKIVVAGGIGNVSGVSNFALLRYLSDGTLDTTFSGDGIVDQAIGVHNDFINDMVLQSDGRFMVAGFVKNGSTNDVAIARFTNDGVLDTTFSSDGYMTYRIGASNDTASAIALQSDNKVILSARSSVSGNREFHVARIDATSSLSTLSALSTTGASLAETFASRTTSYTASVSNGTTSFTVTPIVSEAHATVTVNGTSVTSGSASGAVQLSVGANNIPVVVTAQDGTTRTTYTLTITRAAAPVSGSGQSALSANASLAGITLSSVTYTPTFSSTTTSYTATVTNGIKSTTVIPTLADTTATVKVNGVLVSSGAASSSISLVPGSNTITVLTTAQDGSTTKTYTFTLTRDNTTVKVKKTITAKNVLKSRDVSLASTSKVVITVKSSSKKYCSVSGTSVKGVKKGNCTVVVAVTPKATKSVKKPKTTKTTVTVRVI